MATILDYMTTREVAEMMRVSIRTVYRLARAGKIRRCHPAARRAVFSREEVLAYLRSTREGAAATA